MLASAAHILKVDGGLCLSGLVTSPLVVLSIPG